MLKGRNPDFEFTHRYLNINGDVIACANCKSLCGTLELPITLSSVEDQDFFGASKIFDDCDCDNDYYILLPGGFQSENKYSNILRVFDNISLKTINGEDFLVYYIFLPVIKPNSNNYDEFSLCFPSNITPKKTEVEYDYKTDYNLCEDPNITDFLDNYTCKKTVSPLISKFYVNVDLDGLNLNFEKTRYRIIESRYNKNSVAYSKEVYSRNNSNNYAISKKSFLSKMLLQSLYKNSDIISNREISKYIELVENDKSFPAFGINYINIDLSKIRRSDTIKSLNNDNFSTINSKFVLSKNKRDFKIKYSPKLIL